LIIFVTHKKNDVNQYGFDFFSGILPKKNSLSLPFSLSVQRMSTSLNQEFNQLSQPSSTLILPIPNNPHFLCNILADNAREYIMISNQSFFGLFDVIYAFILAIVLGFMVIFTLIEKKKKI
jgi:hypothetical protein